MEQLKIDDVYLDIRFNKEVDKKRRRKNNDSKEKKTIRTK